jgi:hypothetical protein
MKSGPGLTPAFKRVEELDALSFQRDFHQGSQTVAQRRSEAVGVQQRHFALDQPQLAQAFDAAQASGWREMRQFGQQLVAAGGIGLQQIQQSKIGFIDDDLFHLKSSFEVFQIIFLNAQLLASENKTLDFYFIR